MLRLKAGKKSGICHRVSLHGLDEGARQRCHEPAPRACRILQVSVFKQLGTRCELLDAGVLAALLQQPLEQLQGLWVVLDKTVAQRL